MTAANREGVIKFQAEHRGASLSPRRFADALGALQGWRQVFFDLRLIGQDPTRYDGAGYGNRSVRVGAPSSPRGARHMLITGTQTGGKSELGHADYRAHIAAVAREYKVYRSVPAEPENDYYLVDHTAYSYLMMPQTGFAEVYRREVTPDEMAESMACYIRAAS